MIKRVFSLRYANCGNKVGGEMFFSEDIQCKNFKYIGYINMLSGSIKILINKMIFMRF